MKKLTSQDICNLLDILVGNTEPYGDTAIDEITEQNLKTLIDVGDWILDGVLFAADFYKSPMLSMRVVGMRATGYLANWKKWTAENNELV